MLTDLVVEPGSGDTSQAIRVYRNLTVDTDWSIHLHCQTHGADITRSPLALRLADALKEFGLVHHSVWADIAKHVADKKIDMEE